MYNIYKIFETCVQFRGCALTELQTTIAKPKAEKLPKVYVDNNLHMLPENMLMTDHFKRKEHTNQKPEIEI